MATTVSARLAFKWECPVAMISTSVETSMLALQLNNVSTHLAVIAANVVKVDINPRHLTQTSAKILMSVSLIHTPAAPINAVLTSRVHSNVDEGRLHQRQLPQQLQLLPVQRRVRQQPPHQQVRRQWPLQPKWPQLLKRSLAYQSLYLCSLLYRYPLWPLAYLSAWLYACAKTSHQTKQDKDTGNAVVNIITYN